MPLVGTWIEMKADDEFETLAAVVPLVGTWIEISNRYHFSQLPCRAPRGHVD